MDGLNEWQGRFDRRVMQSMGMPLAKLERGEGARVWDDDGNEYLDFLAGIAVNSLGHAHPVFVEAVSAQAAPARARVQLLRDRARSSSSPSASRASPGRATRAGPGSATPGAEANEAAFKLARLNNSGGARTRVLSLVDAFHGRTMGSLALTGKPHMRDPFEPLPGGVEHIPATIEALEHALDDAVAALFVEPIQGEAGVDRASRRVPRGRSRAHASARRAAHRRRDPDRRRPHRRVVRLPARRHHARCDHGREGHRRRVPDRRARHVRPGVLAVLEGPARLDVRRQPARHRGRRTPCSARSSAPGWSRTPPSAAGRSASGVEGLGSPLVAGIRGRGLLIGVALAEPVATAVAAEAMRAGLIVNAANDSTIRLAPPLIIGDAEIDEFADRFSRALDAVGAARH